MDRFNSSGAGKGSDSRISDHSAYWSSPLWDNMKNKKCDSYSESSKDFTPLVDEYMKESQNIQGGEYIDRSYDSLKIFNR